MRPEAAPPALNLMKDTLTVRASVGDALRRGEDSLNKIRWLYEQGSEFDWDVWGCQQRAVWATDAARALVERERAASALRRHQSKVLQMRIARM